MFTAAFTSALPQYPQARHRKTAWLSRASGLRVLHCEHTWLVYAGLTFSTRPAALCSRRVANVDQAELRMARLRPAFCRTFRPGDSAVPLAERVMLRTFRSSMRIRSYRRAIVVLAFSAQSLLTSALCACRRASLR